MNSYKVLTPLLHDSKRYEIGETVELEPQHAAALTGVVERLLDPSTPPFPETKNTPAFVSPEVTSGSLRRSETKKS